MYVYVRIYIYIYIYPRARGPGAWGPGLDRAWGDRAPPGPQNGLRNTQDSPRYP